jgi:hypothetical protein
MRLEQRDAALGSSGMPVLTATSPSLVVTR